MFLINSQDQYKSDWLKCIKNILNRCGYSNAWISQGNVNPKWLSFSSKQKIFDQFQQKWRYDIENSPKGLSYSLFKEHFEFEHYLNILPDKDRITYCRFRTENHRLPIETGRWHRIERHNIHCDYVNTKNLVTNFIIFFSVDL